MGKLAHRVAEQSCLSLLESCKSLCEFTQVQARIVKVGLRNNPLVLTKFAAVSSELSSIGYGSSFVFSSDADRSLYDAFLYNVVVRAYAQSGEYSKALSAYASMLGDGVSPNKFTYPFVLKACAGLGSLSLGQAVHGSALRNGFGDDAHVGNTVIHMYSCCGGGIGSARKVFDEMPKSEVVSWSAMIGGYVRVGLSAKAVGLFRVMQISGVEPDEITMVLVLSACADLGALELGKWVESYIEKGKIRRSEELCNALIDMFAKCGDVDKALKLFRNMGRNKTIITWTSVIVGLAMHGRGAEAVSLFDEMIECGIRPDNVAFIGLLSACSHSGLVDQGKRYFSQMTREYKIAPKIEHYGCIVDMLCRAGLVKEALDFVRKMPVEPNPVILRTMVSACRAHGELELGAIIGRTLISNDPSHESNYVLLSNIYAKMSHWEKKTNIREAMGKKGVKKTAGSTMIELDHEVYEFVSGDKTHEQHREIREMLEEMARELKKAGYVSETSEVLLDIDEEDKEDALNQHSEKIAIAFALLNTPPGTVIRIAKNLRVCSDCHSASKLLSKIYGREIIVRDRSRFHHFKGGLCSCKDFW